MQVQPYLSFDGRCDEAIAFYRRALKAEVTSVMRFKEMPKSEAGEEGAIPPGSEEKVMHGSLRIGNITVFVSDGRCRGKPDFQGFSLALTASSDAEAEQLFNNLSEGGQVRMPLAKTFFSSRFGMVADRFGVAWMVLVG